MANVFVRDVYDKYPVSQAIEDNKKRHIILYQDYVTYVPGMQIRWMLDLSVYSRRISKYRRPLFWWKRNDS